MYVNVHMHARIYLCMMHKYNTSSDLARPFRRAPIWQVSGSHLCTVQVLRPQRERERERERETQFQ